MTHSGSVWPAIPRDYNAAADFIDRHLVEGRGGKVAFRGGGRELTYGALADRTNRFANVLRSLGFRREQRLVMVMLDTVDFPVVFWGAIKAGVVPVPINTLLAADQCRYILADSRAAGLVVSPGCWEKVAQPAARLSDPGTVIFAGEEGGGAETLRLEKLIEQASPEAVLADTCADEVAFWLYSSGSTGTPKGACHVHSSLIHTARLYGQDVLGIREDDVVFSAAKLFFAYGLGNAMTFPLSVGATAVLMAERPTPDSVQAIMEAEQPSIFYGVPTLYGALLAKGVGRGCGSRRLRACVSAGEPLPRDMGERWRVTVGVDILDGIGSTEMLHIFVSNRHGRIRYGATGEPVPGYQARIVDETGADVPVGEIGELIVKGPSAAEGYWNQREKSRRTFVGEWTYTGDKYRRDADGYYFYCGRTDDMFKVSGIWVSPFDVESALISHETVLEAAVIGREDTDGLMKPMAFVVLKSPDRSEGLLDELREHVKQRSGAWTYPRWIEVRNDLPKTATGKIQRFKLRMEL